MALIVAALASSLVFLPGLADPFSLPKLAYLNVVALLVLAALWYDFIMGYEKITVPLPFLTIPFLVALVVSILIRPITHEAIVQLPLDLIGVLFFIYIANKIRRNQILSVVIAYVLAAMAVALSSLATYRWPQLRSVMGNAAGDVLFGNAKYPVLFVFTAAPLAFYLAGNTYHQWQKNLFIAVTCLLAVFIIFSDAKVVLYGLPLLCIVSIVLTVPGCLSGFSRLHRILIIVMLLFIAGLAVSGVERLLTTQTAPLASDSIQGRLDIWKRSLPLLSLTGIGRGNYQLYSPSVGDPEMWLNTHTHNDYLEMLIESPLALLSLLAIIVSTLALRAGPLGNYLKVSLCAYLIIMFFWFPLALPSLAVSFWIVLGLIYVDGKTGR